MLFRSVSAELLKTLSTESAEQPAEPAPAAPAKPVDAAALAGKWRASRPDGSAIDLTLGADGRYTWKFTQDGQDRKFDGAYSVAENLLILKQGDQATMVGQITPQADGGFNFRLAGANDKGLDFRK